MAKAKRVKIRTTTIQKLLCVCGVPNDFELMVIDVETRSIGISSKSTAMSSIESIATPTLPTSPSARA